MPVTTAEGQPVTRVPGLPDTWTMRMGPNAYWIVKGPQSAIEGNDFRHLIRIPDLPFAIIAQARRDIRDKASGWKVEVHGETLGYCSTAPRALAWMKDELRRQHADAAYTVHPLSGETEGAEPCPSCHGPEHAGDCPVYDETDSTMNED